MRISSSIIILLCASALTCSQTLVVGEQDLADGGVDGGGDADADVDDEIEADADADADEPAGLTCQEVLDCMRACGADLGCGVDCSESICAGSAEAYDALETCGLESCPAECVNLGTPACADCVATACPLQGFACVSAEC